MAITLNELLGDKLVQYDESAGETKEISINELDGKNVALYFSFVYI
jgi:hypothetical protein